MRVLVAFEESGIVRDAFRAMGHDAISCDLQPTARPSPHHRGDIMDFLWANSSMTGFTYFDLIIAHPPCTAISVSGNRWYGKGMLKHSERIKAMSWTLEFIEYAKTIAPRVCIENPVSVLWNELDEKPQYIQPWQFGHPETKKTGLYLYNLPELVPTNIVRDEMLALPAKERHKVWYASPGPERAKLRSRTYQGIADAMADQWG